MKDHPSIERPLNIHSLERCWLLDALGTLRDEAIGFGRW